MRESSKEAHARWAVSALARLGWLVRSDLLIYGEGGWTLAHFDFDHVLVEPTFGDFITSGLLLGGGIEKKLDDYWSLRLGYRFTDFENERVSTAVPGLTANELEYNNLTTHVGRIGITRKLRR